MHLIQVILENVAMRAHPDRMYLLCRQHMITSRWHHGVGVELLPSPQASLHWHVMILQGMRMQTQS